MKNKNAAKKYTDSLLEGGAKEIRFTWEGGNDEGCFHIYVDNEEIDIDYTKKDGSYDLTDYIAEHLNYGSFAGDFNTNGELIYDKDMEAFTGYDSYEELVDHTYTFANPIVLTIPKDLWFDRIDVDVSGYSEDLETSVRLIISNGPVVEEHTEFESRSEELIKLLVDELFEEVDDVNNVYRDAALNREEMPVDIEGNPYMIIPTVIYSKYVEENKDIEIQL